MAKSEKNSSSKGTYPKEDTTLRWESIISVVALLISIGSFIFNIQIEKAKASPNVQVQSVSGGRDLISGNAQDSIIIRGSIVLVNVGNAPTQLVDVRWEFASMSDSQADLGGWLAISDTWTPTDNEFFRSIQDTPVEGIKQTILEPNRPMSLEFKFYSAPLPEYDTTLQNIRIIFTFSNGQEIRVLPELKYFGVSTDY